MIWLIYRIFWLIHRTSWLIRIGCKWSGRWRHLVVTLWTTRKLVAVPTFFCRLFQHWTRTARPAGYDVAFSRLHIACCTDYRLHSADISPDTVFFKRSKNHEKRSYDLLRIMHWGAIHRLRYYVERKKEVISCVTVLSKCTGIGGIRVTRGGAKIAYVT